RIRSDIGRPVEQQHAMVSEVCGRIWIGTLRHPKNRPIRLHDQRNEIPLAVIHAHGAVPAGGFWIAIPGIRKIQTAKYVHLQAASAVISAAATELGAIKYNACVGRLRAVGLYPGGEGDIVVAEVQ